MEDASAKNPARLPLQAKKEPDFTVHMKSALFLFYCPIKKKDVYKIQNDIFVMKLGEVLEVNTNAAKVTGTVPVGQIMVEGLGVGDVGNIVLRDRKHLSQDGLCLLYTSSNEGLIEYSIAKEREELNFNADFTTVRLEIGMMQGLSLAEREDIMVHLDAMETICAQVTPKKERWEMLREHLVWLSGKDVTVAMKILPLFFRIN